MVIQYSIQNLQTNNKVLLIYYHTKRDASKNGASPFFDTLTLIPNNPPLFPNNPALSVNNPAFSSSQKPSLESKQQKVTILLVTNLLVITLFHIFALKS